MTRVLALLTLLLFPVLALAVTVTDSRGEHHFAEVPERVVALNWSIAENLMELGITPVAIADPDGYREWVVRPALPDDMTSIGSRSEPNIERIAALKPDVIIAANAQSDLVDTLEQIAPVLYFEAFSEDHDNYQASRRIFLALADLFGREKAARDKLAAMESRLDQLKDKLRDHFGPTLPKVTAVRFNSPSVVLVYGDNSMPQYALEQLGIEPALPQPASLWGVTQKKVADLSAIREGVLLHIEPFEKADRLFSAPLWRAMPVVRAGRFAAVRSTWTYGGALSLQYLAEAMTEALLTIEPE